MVSKTEQRKAYKILGQAISEIICAQAILHGYAYDKNEGNPKYVDLKTAIEKCNDVKRVLLVDLSSLD